MRELCHELPRLLRLASQLNLLIHIVEEELGGLTPHASLGEEEGGGRREEEEEEEGGGGGGGGGGRREGER